MYKIQQTPQKNLQLGVDGGGRRAIFLPHKHERRANVNRSAIHLGMTVGAEPCLKQDAAQKGSPQTPLPKFTTLSLRNYGFVSIQHLAVLDMKRVMNELLVMKLFTVVVTIKDLLLALLSDFENSFFLELRACKGISKLSTVVEERGNHV